MRELTISFISARRVGQDRTIAKGTRPPLEPSLEQPNDLPSQDIFNYQAGQLFSIFN